MVAEWSGDSSLWGDPKRPEWRDRPRGTKPAEFPPWSMEFRVEIGQGKEETKDPQPPRRPLKPSLSTVQAKIIAHPGRWQIQATRRMRQKRRTETGNTKAGQRRTPPAPLVPGLSMVKAASMAYWFQENCRGVQPTGSEW